MNENDERLRDIIFRRCFQHTQKARAMIGQLLQEGVEVQETGTRHNILGEEGGAEPLLAYRKPDGEIFHEGFPVPGSLVLGLFGVNEEQVA